MNENFITSERQILLGYIRRNETFPTNVKMVSGAGSHPNPVAPEVLGQYRPRDRRKAITTDLEVLEELIAKSQDIPGFLEAGPRESLAFLSGGEGVRAAVVTTGGLAPGLNSVVHAITERHLKTYNMLLGSSGGLWGFQDGFKGLVGDSPNLRPLQVEETETWLDRGGSELGAVRYKGLELSALATKIAANIDRWDFDILYVIGGDGSMRAAHEIAQRVKKTIVVGIPKTMDNDILWVWQSFGFNTAVERAAAFINTMHCEAESTRRVCIVELFGANSGFVAANATLASGHVDLVMIPEDFEGRDKADAEYVLDRYIHYLQHTLNRKSNNPHIVIVLAEGVARLLAKCGASLNGGPIIEDSFPRQFQSCLEHRLCDLSNAAMSAFVVQPRYYVRAVPANAHDQIYCKRLGALAVDNALAGYTDFMISQWLTEYVLVPLELVGQGQKRIPIGGIFWKQVVASTGQPIIPKRAVLP